MQSYKLYYTHVIYVFTIFVINSTILYKFPIMQNKKREEKAIFNINFIIRMFMYVFTIFVINSTIFIQVFYYINKKKKKRKKKKEGD